MIASRRRIPVALVPFLAHLCVLAAAQTPEEIDRTVLAHQQVTKAPAYSVAIVKNGEVVFAKGYGLANVEGDAPATPETIYRIGSLTKTFTATLVMGLVEQGKVKLDEPISTYLPDFPTAYKKVTVRQLLSHTSGFPNYTNLAAFGKEMREPGSVKRMIDMAGEANPDFLPGMGWRYSNTGYIALGELVSEVAKKPWSAVLQEKILTPFGLKDTRLSQWSTVVKGRAAGYAAEKGDIVNAPYLDLGWPDSAGILESTVVDLAKWDAALYDKVLKPETLAQMWTPVIAGGKPTNYGLGFVIGEKAKLKIVGHGGAIPGFESSMVRIPEKKVTVIVLTNLTGGQADALANRLAGLVVPELAPKATPITDADPEMTTFIRGKFEKLLKGELTSDELTPEFAKVMTPQLVKDVSTAMGQLGAISKFDLIESKKEGETTIRSYLVTIGPATLTATFYVTAEKKIAGIQLKG